MLDYLSLKCGIRTIRIESVLHLRKCNLISCLVFSATSPAAVSPAAREMSGGNSRSRKQTLPIRNRLFARNKHDVLSKPQRRSKGTSVESPHDALNLRLGGQLDAGREAWWGSLHRGGRPLCVEEGPLELATSPGGCSHAGFWLVRARGACGYLLGWQQAHRSQ